MVPLTVRVHPGLTLDVGTLYRDGEMLTIAPPRRSMYDQLCSYLHSVEPAPNIRRPLHPWILGIGATALCLRWGTYLAFLWDENKPVDRRVYKPESSLMDDSEMARINIEASANLAELLTLQEGAPEDFARLIWAAYTHLPMPWRKVKPARDLPVRIIVGCMSLPPSLLRQDAPGLAQRSERPMRAYANMLINSFWRNSSPVEDLHAGRVSVYPLTLRRAAPNQEHAVLRCVSERLSTTLSLPAPWQPQPAASRLPWPTCVEALYAASLITLAPFGWTLTESCRQVQLDLDSLGEAQAPVLHADSSQSPMRLS